MNKYRIFAGWAAILMAVAVMLGALGAHALQKVLEPEQLQSFETGVRYQAWHALALLAIQLIPPGWISSKTQLWTSRLMVGGIFAFSFSIYLLNLRELLGMPWAAPVLGPITPIGGLLLIAAWVLLAVGLLRRSSVKDTL